MASVYLGRLAGPLGFNKLFVIKTLRDELADGHEDYVTMFLDEARLSARLNHPNIVQTYDVGEDNGRYFMAMEYLEGQSLRAVDKRLSPGFPLSHQLRVLSELGKGLHHAHELRDYDGKPLHVVHRDVSPHNVVLTYDGQVKLLDFGIAKAQSAMHLTKVGVIKGKAEYIAPEQVRGEQIDRRADVFSLGAMMYEALSGTRFAGGPQVAEATKIQRRVTGGERKLREVSPDLPEALLQICERAISLSPGNRQPTALEFSREIDEYLEQQGGRVPTADGLGALLDPAFGAERERVRALIERQEREDSGEVASFDLREASRTLSGRPRPSGAPDDPRITLTASELARTPVPGRSNRLALPIALALLCMVAASSAYFFTEPAPVPGRAMIIPKTEAAPMAAQAEPETAREPAPVVRAQRSEPRVKRPAAVAAQRTQRASALKPLKRRAEKHERPRHVEKPVAAPQPVAHPEPVKATPARMEPGDELRDLVPARKRRGLLELDGDPYR
jgi:hypothetical protein